MIVAAPQAPILPPIRDASASTLTQVQLDLPKIEGFSAGGLPILSYQVQTSSDNTMWTPIVGLSTNNPNTFFAQVGLTTGQGWYYRYLVKNAVGWSLPSPNMFTMIGTEPS